MTLPEAKVIAERLARVRERIAAAAARGGRPDADVTIVAVTKSHPVEVCRAALEAGLRELGENRVAELAEKRPAVAGDPRWHLVGRLQRNKARLAAPLFHLFHALDSVRLAAALAREGEELGRRLPVLVQLNASGEASKAGIAPEAVVDFVGGVLESGALEVRGLMTMAPLTDDEGVLRRTFARTRATAEEAARQLAGFTPRLLSMGMSNDYELAVEEGSTMVRLGTVLFGERQA
jgi:PLP dependent protein